MRDLVFFFFFFFFNDTATTEIYTLSLHDALPISTFALLPDTKANYIFPMASIQYFSVANFDQFQVLMVRPLYWFGTNGTVALNDQLSLAAEPQYSADGRTVTIHLKNYRWSNGQPVTSRDIEFWMNLLKANKQSWAAYVPGAFPD